MSKLELVRPIDYARVNREALAHSHDLIRALLPDGETNGALQIVTRAADRLLSISFGHRRAERTRGGCGRRRCCPAHRARQRYLSSDRRLLFIDFDARERTGFAPVAQGEDLLGPIAHAGRRRGSLEACNA